MEKGWGNGLCRPGWDNYGRFPLTVISLAYSLGTKLSLLTCRTRGHDAEIHYSHFSPVRNRGKKKKKEKPAIG